MKMTTSNENVITKKDLQKMFWRSLPMEFSWHYERQMHMGFAFMVAKGLEKIYKDDKKGLSEALERHLEFFNITPHVSPFVGGIVLAMEEMNAKDPNFDTSSINAVKATLMGPLSGIGDSLLLGTLRVLAIGIGTSLAVQGSVLGPILFLLIFNVPAFALRYFCSMKGYELGANYLTKIQQSGLMKKFMLAASILGVMVIGGMTNELVSVTTPLAIDSRYFKWNFARYVAFGCNRNILLFDEKGNQCSMVDYWYSCCRHCMCTIRDFRINRKGW